MLDMIYQMLFYLVVRAALVGAAVVGIIWFLVWLFG